jgi:hypothetical protein
MVEDILARWPLFRLRVEHPLGQTPDLGTVDARYLSYRALNYFLLQSFYIVSLKWGFQSQTLIE